MKKLRYLLLLVLAVTLLCAAGCNDEKNSSAGIGDKTTITADTGNAPDAAVPEKDKSKTGNSKLAIKVY